MTLWTDLLGAEVRWVNVGGVRTRVVSQGTGRPVVLLHGRGGHLETWARTVPALARERYVIAADLLGHGLTAAPPCSWGWVAGRDVAGEYTVDRLLAHLVDLLDALGLHRVDLVGQSLGGWVAALLAATSPARVGRLVLVEPAGLQPERERLEDPRVRSAYQRGGQAFAEATAETVRARLVGLVADPAQISDELVATRLRLYAPEPARAVHRAVRAADNGRWLLTPDLLAGIRAPVLLLHGADGHTPAEILDRATAAIPGARRVTVPAARQWPHFEQPGLVNDEIIRFLAAPHPEDDNDVLA